MERELVYDKDIGRYFLKTYDKENDLKTEKGYKKEELKEIHESLNSQLAQLNSAITQGQKQADMNKVDLSDEEKKIADMMEKATKYIQYKKQTEQLEKQKEDRELFKKQKAEIEARIPELKRK